MKKKYKKKTAKNIVINLKKKIYSLYKIIRKREFKMKQHIKAQIHAEIHRQRLNKFAKLLVAYFSRGFYFKINAFRVIQRIMQKQKISFSSLNVNFNFNT